VRPPARATRLFGPGARAAGALRCRSANRRREACGGCQASTGAEAVRRPAVPTISWLPMMPVAPTIAPDVLYDQGEHRIPPARAQGSQPGSQTGQHACGPARTAVVVAPPATCTPNVSHVLARTPGSALQAGGRRVTRVRRTLTARPMSERDRCTGGHRPGRIGEPSTMCQHLREAQRSRITAKPDLRSIATFMVKLRCSA
jgi:hypothetical protein